MKSFIRPMLVMSLILLVPIVPFLLFGTDFEAWVKHWSEQSYSKPATALIIVGLLATDILLPTPSSMLSTLGGWQLGIIGGTIGAVGAFTQSLLHINSGDSGTAVCLCPITRFPD